MNTASSTAGVNDNNIMIVYLKTNLTFEDIIPSMKEYLLERYKGLNNIIHMSLKNKIYDAVGNVKNIFENLYKSGLTMYSNVHGKLEIDILNYALKPFIIKTGHIRSEDKAIIVIKDEDIIRAENMYNKKLIFNKDLMEEIEKHTKNYIVTEDGDVIRR